MLGGDGWWWWVVDGGWWVAGSGRWVVGGIIYSRAEQRCDPTQISPNSPDMIDDRVNKISNTNITDHRSCSQQSCQKGLSALPRYL